MTMPKLEIAQGWVGQEILDVHGERLGTCTSMYTDDATLVPEWLRVRLADGREVLAPILDAAGSDEGVRLAVDGAVVRSAPTSGTHGHATETEEMDLYRHYGIPHSTAASSTVLPPIETSRGGAAPGVMRHWMKPLLVAAGAGAAAAAVGTMGVRRWRARATPPRVRWARSGRERAGRVGGAAARGTMSTAAAGVMAGQALAGPAGRLSRRSAQAVTSATAGAVPIVAAGAAEAQRAVRRTPRGAVMIAGAGFVLGYAVRALTRRRAVHEEIPLLEPAAEAGSDVTG